MNDDYTLFETTARVREWRLLTGDDFEAMDRSRTVAIVSCSPLEVHGPHLPVMADYVESDAIAVRTMEGLCERFDDISFVHLPALWVATDVLPRPGSVNFRPSTLKRALVDLGRSLTRQGFKHVWVMNFHGGPRHFLAIEAACVEVNRRFGGGMVPVFSLLIQRLTGGGTDVSELLGRVKGLDQSLLGGDTHGGLVETSILLHLAGKHVKDSYKTLPRETVDMWRDRTGRPRVNDGDNAPFWDVARSLVGKVQFYATTTYSGAPAAGSAEIGDQVLAQFGDYAADALSEIWTGKIGPADCHSPLWKLRWLLLNEPFVEWFKRAVGATTRVF